MPMMSMAIFGPETPGAVVVAAAMDELGEDGNGDEDKDEDEDGEEDEGEDEDKGKDEDEDKGEELVIVELGKLRVDCVDGALTVEVTTSIRFEVVLVTVEVTVKSSPMVVVKT
jgi:hypothetical protein